MEEINNKAYSDELNKAEEEIQESPSKYIPVPKLKKKEEKNDEPKENA